MTFEIFRGMCKPDVFLPFLKEECSDADTFGLVFSRSYVTFAEDRYGKDRAITITDPCGSVSR